MSFRTTGRVGLIGTALIVGLLSQSWAEAGWAHSDVGGVGVRGTASVGKTGRIKVSGAGTDIGSTADSFHYLYQQLASDGTIVVRIASLTKTSGWAKGGVMFRQTLRASSINASLLVTPSNGILFQRRTTSGGTTSVTKTAGVAPRWLRISRSGTSVSAAVSTDGVTWKTVGTASVPFAGPIYVGMAVSSHVYAKLATGTFDSAKISTAVTPPGTGTGLVAAWSFDEGSGTVAGDQLGVNQGTITGASWTSSGKFGNALVFDGLGSTVTVNDNPVLDLSRALTLEAWVRPQTLASWRTLLMKENDAGASYALYAMADTVAPAGHVNTDTQDVKAAGTAQLPLDAWSHVAATYDGSSLRLFVNGIEMAAQNATGAIVQTTGALRIGGNAIWGEFFHGAIDNVRIYNRALSAAEIQTNMNTAVLPAPEPIDTTPPTVVITAPGSGSTISGTVSVSAAASDAVGVTSVQLLVNGSALAPAFTAAPYEAAWNTTTLANGTYTLKGIARDAAGNSAESAPVTVTVNNVIADTTPPVVAVTAPGAGTTLSGMVTVSATATDNIGVKSVELLVDGVSLGTILTSTPYARSWNTFTAINGTHVVTAIARDAAGNSGMSASVRVTVSNVVVSNPRFVEFKSADHNTILPTGQPAVSGYTLEIWEAGKDPSTAQPYQTAAMGKPSSTSTSLKVDQQSVFRTLPINQQYFSTVLVTGPAGTARSGPSDPFKVE